MLPPTLTDCDLNDCPTHPGTVTPCGPLMSLVHATTTREAAFSPQVLLGSPTVWAVTCSPHQIPALLFPIRKLRFTLPGHAQLKGPEKLSVLFLVHFPGIQSCVLSLPAVWSSMQALAAHLLLDSPKVRIVSSRNDFYL